MAQFSLLTLNCFGVPAPSTRTRLRGLAAAVNRIGADVVCLQEVQAMPYRDVLTQALDYPDHAAIPHLHAPKGGLLTLARPPIEEFGFIPYDEPPLWYTPGIADWLLHKGILKVRFYVGDQLVIVLNTHLHANYSGDWSPRNRYAQHEYAQLRQLALFVAEQPAHALVLVAGDFNIPRGSWLYREFLDATRMIDPLEGDTRPTLRPPPGFPDRYAAPIDFALYRDPGLPNVRAAADLRLRDPIVLPNGREDYPSDHCGVELRLTWDAG